MKKALVIFLALATVCAVFADEPAAEVKVAEFKGDAAVTFGVDLDQEKTGFKNETSGSLKLNLMNGGERSTTGDGIWGELKIKIDGLQIKAKADANYALVEKKDNDNEDNIRVEIDTAKIHFGPAYMGITSGDFNYGGDFWYPHALNYKDKNDALNRSPSEKLGYDQGIVLGFKNDMFKVEASVRSKKDGKDETKKIAVSNPSATKSVKGAKYYTIYLGDEVEAEGDGVTNINNLFTPAATEVYTKGKTEVNYWTNKYALGVYAETTPIKDLRVGVGAAYALGYRDATGDDDNKKDFTVFAGTDYRFNFNEAFFIQPTVTYNLYQDFNVVADTYTTKINKLNTGLRFGFAKSKSSTDNSLLYDFFGEKALVYEMKKAYNDKGDDTLLPGVSVFGSFDFKTDAMKTSLPLMATFYSGDIVKGLNVAALLSANVAPKASDISYVSASLLGSSGSVAGMMNKTIYNMMIGGKGLQVGTAVSYDVKVGDMMTIVPAAGFLWTHSSLKGDHSSKMLADQFKIEAKVDVKGLVSNTTFTLFWDGATFGKGTMKAYKMMGIKFDEITVYETKKGLLGLKAKIAF